MDGFEVIGWRLDLVLLLVVGAVLTTTGVVSLIIAAKRGDRFGWSVGWSVIGGILTIFGGASLLVFGIYLAPFNSTYHNWYSTTGTVETVTNMFESGSGEVTAGYVVEMDSVDRPMLFSDARIIRAEGSEIDIACSVEWVPSGADRLNCWIAE